MLFDEKGEPLEFLEILSVASSIVWFKSMTEVSANDKLIMGDIDGIKSHLSDLERKIDKILSILEK